MRIEICGGIASGKTTLARLLGRSGFPTCLEQFSKNPFYQAFYEDPAKYAFETEVTFLLQHYHQIKLFTLKHSRICCDFSLVLDQAYAYVTLSSRRLSLFRATANFVTSELPARTLLVHLECNPADELFRVKRRGRSVETKITVSYLEALNASLRQRISALPASTNVLSIDSSKIDFANSPIARKHVLAKVREALR